MFSNDKNSNSSGNAGGERQWIEQLRQGDKAGFEAIYRLYFPKLSQFVYRYVHSTYVAEDLVHNVFFGLWRNRENLEPVATLRPYLYRAVRNQAIKHITRSDDEVVLGYPMSSIADRDTWNPDELLQESELEEAVIEAVRQLPAKRRQIYLLHREDGLTYKEIAEVLDISIKTVETQMSRSLRFLRTSLSDFLSVAGMMLPLVKGWF